MAIKLKKEIIDSKMAYKRIIIIVLDSAGVGFLPDADKYGDLGANTLGHIGEAVQLDMPNSGALGLGNIIDIKGTPPAANPLGKYGKAAEKSSGKDTTTGHWEIAGTILEKPFPVFPQGFPDEIIQDFQNQTGKKILGNITASGTEIINTLGDEHVKTGCPIVYTSADSVFQIAAHEDVISVSQLYEICEKARIILDKYMVARVIARPFAGTSGQYKRTSNRHDFSIVPFEETVLDRLKSKGKDVIGVGKINDIFAGKGLTESVRTVSNMDGVDRTIEYIKKNNQGLIFTNLVDFDMVYGHRRDVLGYKKALEEFDSRLPEIKNQMNENDLLILTADHGCDPVFKGTDHTREYIPVIAWSENIMPEDIGTRKSFSDIAAAVEQVLLNTENKNSFIR